MRKLVAICVVTIIACLTLAADTPDAQKPRKADDSKMLPPIRVLLTTGGHAFERKEYFAMWDSLPGVKYTECVLPKDADLLKPGLEKQYDVVAMYDMTPKFTAEQETNFVDLIQSGMPLVSLHHNLCSRDDSPAFHQIIGGQYVHKPTTIDGKLYEPCTYKHSQQMDVKVADTSSYITRGLSDFHIEDEAYHGFYVSPKVHVLLTVDHPLCGHEICWTTEFGKGRVFYLMLGHDHVAWQNPAYPKLLLHGIQWAGKRQSAT